MENIKWERFLALPETVYSMKMVIPDEALEFSKFLKDSDDKLQKSKKELPHES